MLVKIHPYYLQGFDTWVFDDPKTGLKAEAFVSGMSEIIDATLSEKGLLTSARKTGFTLSFSDNFDDAPNFDVELVHLYQGAPNWKHPTTQQVPDITGNWYRALIGGKLLKGWLCPALFLYFKEAPKYIYCTATSLENGINPIWEIPIGTQPERKFITF